MTEKVDLKRHCGMYQNYVVRRKLLEFVLYKDRPRCLKVHREESEAFRIGVGLTGMRGTSVEIKYVCG